MALSDGAAVGLEILSLTLTTVFVVLRGYVQIYLRAIFTASDCLIFLAYLIFFLIFVGDIYCYSAGQWEFSFGSPGAIDNALKVFKSEGELRAILKILYVSGPLYFVCVWCIKAAFLLFYFVLFPKVFPYLRRFLKFTAAFTFATGVTSFCLLMFSCRPVPRNWALDQTLCASFNTPHAYWFSVATHIFSDLCIYSMPFFLLSNLSLSRTRKLGVIAMFALGFVSIAVGIVRVVLVASTNFQQSYVNSLSAIEMATAVMVACSPPLKNLSLWRRMGRGSVKDDITEWGTIRLGMAMEDIESAQREQASSIRISGLPVENTRNEMEVTVHIDPNELEKARAGSGEPNGIR